MKKVLFVLIALGLLQSMYASSVYQALRDISQSNYCDEAKARKSGPSKTTVVLNSNDSTVVEYANGGGFSGNQKWVCVVKDWHHSYSDKAGPNSTKPKHITIILMKNTTPKGTYHIYDDQDRNGKYLTTY